MVSASRVPACSTTSDVDGAGSGRDHDEPREREVPGVIAVQELTKVPGMEHCLVRTV
jgi:hypothetical protein